MDTTSPIAPRLVPVLLRVRRRIRRVVGSRGALITLVAALAGLLVMVALDHFAPPMPAIVRWLLLAGWIAAVVWVAIVQVWLPLRRPLALVRVARWLEINHPELDERVSTVLEVGTGSGHGMSKQLVDALADEAAASLGRIDPADEVSARRALRWLAPAFASVMVWVVLLVLWPAVTARHLARVLAPSAALGNAAGRFLVAPGSIEGFEGEPVTITARHSSGPATALDLVLFHADGSGAVLAMVPAGEGAAITLAKPVRGFDYEVRAGRESSDRYKVSLWPQPRLPDARVRLEFPAYTGWAAREQALGEGISALAGTTITLRAKPNTPITSAVLDAGGTTLATATIEQAATGGMMTLRWTLGQAGKTSARVLLAHRLGREFAAREFSIDTIPDKPPAVEWLGARPEGLRMRPDDMLDMGYAITEDIGLAAVHLDVLPERGDPEKLNMDMPPQAGKSNPPHWRGRVRQPLAALLARWPQAREFKLRVVATDTLPVAAGGPGTGASEWMVVRIDQGAESMARQDVAAGQADARQTIEQARQLVQQAGQKIARNQHELRAENVPANAREEFAKSRAQLAEAKDMLEKLADRMRESITAARAPEVDEAAKSTDMARQQLEDAPLHDTPEQRAEAAAAAREATARAERQLEKLRDKLQQDAPKFEDYARLKEIEGNQREVARQAEQAAAAVPPGTGGNVKPDDQIRQQQEQIAGALRQQLRQQPRAEAAALRQQASEAAELAAAARARASAQDAMKHQAEATDIAGLKDQLAKAQQDVAASARGELAGARARQDHPTANALPEAIEPAEAAARELADDNTADAAKQAEQAAEKFEELAKAAASARQDAADPVAAANTATAMVDLAERQNQVAGAAAAMAADKPAEAAAILAGIQADQAADLAAEVRAMPRIDGQSGAVQQAVQASARGAEDAKQAGVAQATGNGAAAAHRHGQAARGLADAAAQLDQAASDFARQAGAAAGRAAGDRQAPVPAAPLAAAFQQAGKAADARDPASTAAHASAAAAALAQAADGTLRALQGQSMSQPPGIAGPLAGQPDHQSMDPAASAGESPERAAQADPGVPPELAKLGISAADWEQIKSSLRTDAGQSSTLALPAEYRDLARQYFQEIAKDNPP